MCRPMDGSHCHEGSGKLLPNNQNKQGPKGLFFFLVCFGMDILYCLSLIDQRNLFGSI